MPSGLKNKHRLHLGIALVSILTGVILTSSLYPEFRIFRDKDLTLYYGEVMTQQQLIAEAYNPICTPLYPSSWERFLKQLAYQPTTICFASAYELNDWLVLTGRGRLY